MSHPYFTGQVVADHEADLIEQARRHRLIRHAAAHGDRASEAGEIPRPRTARLRPWTRMEPHVSTPKQRSPLPLFNMLLAASALTVAVVAIATDQAASRPTLTVVTARDENHPAVAPDDALPVDEDITVADQPRQYNPYQTQTNRAGTPADNCRIRHLVVRC